MNTETVVQRRSTSTPPGTARATRTASQQIAAAKPRATGSAQANATAAVPNPSASTMKMRSGCSAGLPMFSIQTNGARAPRPRAAETRTPVRAASTRNGAKMRMYETRLSGADPLTARSAIVGAKAKRQAPRSAEAPVTGRTPVASVCGMSCWRPSATSRDIARTMPTSAPICAIRVKIMNSATASKKMPASVAPSPCDTTSRSTNPKTPKAMPPAIPSAPPRATFDRSLR